VPESFGVPLRAKRGAHSRDYKSNHFRTILQTLQGQGKEATPNGLGGGNKVLI